MTVTGARPRGTAASVTEGLRRVISAPAVLAGVWMVTVLAALPLAVTLQRAISADLGASLEAEQAVRGVNWDWWQEFQFRHPWASDTFQPTVIGFAAPLRNLSAWLAGDWAEWPVAAAAAVYIAAWMFLLGGVIDRYARQRRLRTHGFFGVSGVFFFRFLRLGILAALVWTFVFGIVHDWLFESALPWVTRDLSVERTAFIWWVIFAALFVLLAAAIMLVFDYAKVRAVVEDRRSMIGALIAAGRFVRRHPGAAVGPFLANAALFAVVLAAYAVAAGGAGGGETWRVLGGLLLAQLYVLARIVVKLSFYASAVVVLQDRLAHAAWTAAPQPIWPDSPAVEAIVNAAPAAPR
jgi:hypothetical protein